MLLTSRIPPLNSYKIGFAETFFDLLSEAERVRIAVGYISADSIMELHGALSRNFPRKSIFLDLILGMHFYAGITRTQLKSIQILNDYFESNSLGYVKISNRVKFHGKVYCFYKKSVPTSCLIGSSNLSNITKAHSSFEVDVLSTDEVTLRSVNNVLDDLEHRSAISLSDWEDPKINEMPSPLEGYGLSEKVSSKEINALVLNKTDISFEIPLKAEEKSNLNAFFGKGREGKNGFIIPRPWYEIEIIVSKIITEDPNYPKGEFTLVTQDGWKFACKTSGDYHKNFRSTPDLQILGRWIKGAMENKGVLNVGAPVTGKTLSEFGRDSFRITKTKIPHTWLAEL